MLVGLRRYAMIVGGLLALGSTYADRPFDIGSIAATRYSTPEGVIAVMDPAVPYLSEALELYVGRDRTVRLPPELHAHLQRDASDVIGRILVDADARGTGNRLVTPGELEATLAAMKAEAASSGIASRALR